ncbi:PAS domain S-box protein [Maridesulfovibrio hydrothermalis]|uniref:histidine kinase n=1 Tax=Maridesulfovibrio hydrothermalis AM13 = DSM 14728 TaxID=1121451 RepID=L0RBU7_9BACT|nr:PAS domain S-box protein [Maridesulfovibrio hydrothermalis]CCO23697.1 PAS/PAC sensor signal transduction histidine kinase (modular protein) [Maridesulfovibrio hydrothermalis AM13 = DSM 14728]
MMLIRLLSSRIKADVCGFMVTLYMLLAAPSLAIASGDGAFVWPVSVSEGTVWALSAIALFVIFFAFFSFLRPAGLCKKLVSAFLLVSLLPICVLAILDQKVTARALSENSQQAMLSAASHTAGAIDSFLLANLSTVRTESTIPQFSIYLRLPPDMRSGSPEEQAVMGILNSLKRRDQANITSIAILDLRGRAVADTYGPDIGKDKSCRDYFTSPMKTGLPYVSDVGLSSTSRQLSLYFSSPIRDTAGKILGILRFRYNAAILQKLLLPSGLLGEHAYSAVLFGNEGLRLADSERPDLVLVPFFSLGQEAWKRIGFDRRINVVDKKPVGIGISRSEFVDPEVTFFNTSLYGSDGMPTLNVKFPIRYAPWTLILGYSETSNLAKIATQSRYALAVVLCIVLGVVLTSLAAIRSIIRPLETLTKAVRELGKGNETVQVSIKSSDEIGELAATFNNMSKALYLSHQKVIASSERLQTLLDTLPDSVTVHDTEGNFLDINDSFEVGYGYSADELENLSISDISGAGLTQEQASERVAACIKEGYQNFDWVARHKDGREFPVHIKLRRFDLPEGIRVMALVSDITERKQAELELLQARNYIANIIDSMPSLLVSVDADGMITQWNIQAEKVTGLKREIAVGQPFEKVIPRLSGEMKRVRKAMQSRSFIGETKRIHNVDGKVCYEDVSIFPLVANGVEGAVIRIDDVTERVQLEQMMVQSEKMLSVGGLAAGMAHEINNPLAGIMGSVQNIRNRLLEDAPKNREAAQKCDIVLENMHAYLEMRDIPKMISGIHESGARAAKIVSNVLNFSRKSGGGFASNDIAELLDKSLELIGSDYDLKKNYDFKNLRVQKDYQPGLGPVYCESSQVQQVFLNLFKNAAEALAEKDFQGELPVLNLRVRKEAGMAVVEIKDNGPGLDKKTCKRIFEPFFTTKPPGKGIGLGLSVSYFIITDQHGGNMEVSSELGKWTKFVVKLPFANSSDEQG